MESAGAGSAAASAAAAAAAAQAAAAQAASSGADPARGEKLSKGAGEGHRGSVARKGTKESALDPHVEEAIRLDREQMSRGPCGVPGNEGMTGMVPPMVYFRNRMSVDSLRRAGSQEGGGLDPARLCSGSIISVVDDSDDEKEGGKRGSKAAKALAEVAKAQSAGASGAPARNLQAKSQSPRPPGPPGTGSVLRGEGGSEGTEKLGVGLSSVGETEKSPRPSPRLANDLIALGEQLPALHHMGDSEFLDPADDFEGDTALELPDWLKEVTSTVVEEPKEDSESGLSDLSD